MHDPSHFAGVEPLVISGVMEPLTSIGTLPSGNQTSELVFEESLDEVMDIEWPTVAPFCPKFITCSADDLLEQLHDLIERRPLPSWADSREFLRLATLSYHTMGFPKDPWMAALERTWAEFSVLQHQESNQRRWLAKVLPEIHLVEAELESSRGHSKKMISDLEELFVQETTVIERVDADLTRI